MKETEGKVVSEEAEKELSEEEEEGEGEDLPEDGKSSEGEQGVPSGTEEVSEDGVLAERFIVAGGSQEPLIPARRELGTESGSRRK